MSEILNMPPDAANIFTRNYSQEVSFFIPDAILSTLTPTKYNHSRYSRDGSFIMQFSGERRLFS
jgi:hypothetical protein